MAPREAEDQYYGVLDRAAALAYLRACAASSQPKDSAPIARESTFKVKIKQIKLNNSSLSIFLHQNF